MPACSGRRGWRLMRWFVEESLVQIRGRVIGHISFDISHLSFLSSHFSGPLRFQLKTSKYR